MGGWQFKTSRGQTRARREGDARAAGIAIVVGLSGVLATATVALSVRAAHRVNRTPMAAAQRDVAVVKSQTATYRPSLRLVGAAEPWIEANVGPQYISAYVKTVLVRPGAIVRRGQVLATLDCANPSARSRALAMRAQGDVAQMHASASEAQRTASLLQGGFVAPNDVDQKNAASTAARAQLLETRASLARAALDVDDCVLRAPFDGEIGTRTIDPGAFVHPGQAIVSVVDRKTVRVTVEASEKDFESLAPGLPVEVSFVATGGHVDAPIARRAPRADPASRTIHVEVDVPDPDRSYPVGTTAMVRLETGKPVPAVSVPIYAAKLAGGKAKLFVVESGVVRVQTVPVLGEIGGRLFVAAGRLPATALIVTEERDLLTDGQPVRAHLEPEVAAERQAGAPSEEPARRGGGFGRPL